MQQYMFYFAISDYCFCQYNVYESPRDDVNGGVFIQHIFAYFGPNHVIMYDLNKLNMIAYVDYTNVKNECFMPLLVYFVIRCFYVM